jgi:hypothetical protein
MALAHRHAALSPNGRRTLGDSNEPPDEAHTARVLICLHQGHLVALHGFIKKTRTTQAGELELARRRRKELEK